MTYHLIRLSGKTSVDRRRKRVGVETQQSSLKGKDLCDVLATSFTI